MVINGESSAWNDVNSGVHQAHFGTCIIRLVYKRTDYPCLDLTTDCLPLK